MFSPNDQKFLVDLVSYAMGLFSGVIFLFMLINRLFNLFGKGMSLVFRKVTAE